MKLRLILCAIVALFCVGFSYGQAVQDSTITLIVPVKFDLTTAQGIKEFIGLIVTMIITLVGGVWAKGRAFLAKYLPTTERKVAFIGLLGSIAVGFTFGFTKDTIGILVMGVFATMGLYGSAKSAAKTEPIPSNN